MENVVTRPDAYQLVQMRLDFGRLAGKVKEMHGLEPEECAVLFAVGRAGSAGATYEYLAVSCALEHKQAAIICNKLAYPPMLSHASLVEIHATGTHKKRLVYLTDIGQIKYEYMFCT